MRVSAQFTLYMNPKKPEKLLKMKEKEGSLRVLFLRVLNSN